MYSTCTIPTLADAIKRDNPEYTTQIVTDDAMFEKATVSQAYYDTLSTDNWLNTPPSIAIVQNGLWTENRAGKTEDNLPVYFFRGAPQNNYVFFANKMWRIVRINEDGSVKLILGGNSTSDGFGGTTTPFSHNIDSQIYFNYNNSSTALRINNLNWYSAVLASYESYIADTKFCNDQSVGRTSFADVFYGAYIRLYTNKTPQYKCPNASDNLIYKIGALTADEIVYAGGRFGTINRSYYLNDNAQGNSALSYWWLMSPYYYYNGYTYGFLVYSSSNSGSLYVDYLNTYIGFRPVVSLKSDTLILRGDGKHSSPYVITE